MLKNEIAGRPLGAWYDKSRKGTVFRVWAPNVSTLHLVLVSKSGAEEAKHELKKEDDDDDETYHLFVSGIEPGRRYLFELEGGDRLPDPASRYQPTGPQGPSEIVGESFSWEDEAWKGVSLKEMVLYELHIGTFTKEGTFESAIKEIPRLKELGINAIEIMPISEFSGDRNWGYDGVYPHAAQSSYGGPEGLKKLINECHKQGIGVVLDMVYNHLGPEGNFLPRYFPVFQSKYHTPWGQAINFDGAGSDGVKQYFLQTVWQWLDEYHMDGLRLDAIQTILDTSPTPFLEQLTNLKREIEKDTGRTISIIGETDANDPKVIAPTERGGLGLDAHWNDDFHHTVHVLVTNEDQGYYKDFSGLEDLERLYTRGLAFEGRYSPYRGHTQGRKYENYSPEQLVICSQNHDQIGNRMHGDRLSTLVDFEQLKLAASMVLLSPFMPMLYMGEEYGEKNPFLYFVSHQSEELNEAVRKGRREEFKSFKFTDEAPDPVAIETFEKSKLNPEHQKSKEGIALQSLYKRLIGLSKAIRREGILAFDKVRAERIGDNQGLKLCGLEGWNVLFNLSHKSITLKAPRELAELVIDSSMYQPGVAVTDDMIRARIEDMRAKSYALNPHSALAFRGQSE